MAAAFEHTSVLLDEAIEALGVTPGGCYCDGTIGGGGHARVILDRCAPDGVLVGLDRDPDALAASRSALSGAGERVILQQANFAEMVSIIEALGLLPIDGILLDLGVSSHQLETSSRGFSFAKDGPLDMRMDPTRGLTAAEIIASVSEKELAELLREFGEERNGRRIARAIKQAQGRGELNTTSDLAALVVTRQPAAARAARIHPATRTFQALRIAVNGELGALDRFLDTFIDALRPGGRVVVISFHSLEDRRVKRRFAELADPCICPPSLPMCGCNRQPALRLLRKGAVKAGDEEIIRNPRARSARLRAAERL